LRPNAQAQQRRGPNELHIWESLHAPAVCCSVWFIPLRRAAVPACRELGYSFSKVRRPCPYSLWCIEPVRSARWFDWDGERFRPFRLATARRHPPAAADPVGTAGASADSPRRACLRPPPDIVEGASEVRMRMPLTTTGNPPAMLEYSPHVSAVLRKTAQSARR
jgi:hypothetical protein